MKASRVFKILSILVLLTFVFGQAGVPAIAQVPPVQKERVVRPQVSLAEVENYYGLLSQQQGSLKLVVELIDDPAAVVFAAAGGAGQSAVQQAQAQLAQINRSQAAFLQSAQTAGVTVTEIYRVQRVYNGVALIADAGDLKALAALPNVKAIHPLVSKSIEHVTSVPMVGALQMWANTTSFLGEGIDIGIIDTGIDYTHKDFGGAGTPAAFAANDPTLIEPGSFPTIKVVGGYDFAGDNYDASGDFGPTTPSPDPDPLDCNGHGSHVAGTAAGYGTLKSDGSNPAPTDYAGYAALSSADYINLFKIGPGMAPQANLYALKVFGCEGSTDLTDLAIEWAMDPNGDGDLSDHLDVINMSLGSAFGLETDTSAIASNNAAMAGIIVVISAGNNGDVYYITGSPGVAQRAISTANIVDASGVAGGFEVVNDTTPPPSLKGVHPAVSADFGPPTSVPGLTGELVAAAPINGCTPLTNAAAVAGKIALIDRGACTFTAKVQNAQLAGATGVLVANNVPGHPFVMGGTPTIPVTIPSMLTTLAVGNALKAALPGGVTVRLTAEFENTIVNIDPAIVDTINTGSSRGPRRGDTGLKPDIAAPGDTIFSAAVGTGSDGASFNGTSMSSPHVAGAMALLRQMHPSWSVEELKALVMNTATHDIYTNTAKTVKVNLDRVGSGRMDLANSLNSNLIAYSLDAQGSVNVSFGFQEVVDKHVGVDLTLTRKVLVVNKSAHDETVTLTFDPRYTANPGVTYQLYDEDYLLSPDDTCLIPAGGSKEFIIKLKLDAEVMARLRDPSAGAGDAFGLARHYLTQSGGYFVVTPETIGAPVLRVGIYAAHRPASGREFAGDAVAIGASETGLTPLPMTGTEITAPEFAFAFLGELLHQSPDDPWSTGFNNNADLQAVGVASDYPLYVDPLLGLENVAVYFGLASYGSWSTANEVEFHVYIDSDKDGVPDWVGLNANTGLFSGTTSDTYGSVFCPYPLPTSAAALAAQCDFWYFLNGLSAANNTNPFNTNVMLLALPAAPLGLTEDNTDFNFTVVTFNRENEDPVDTTPWLHYDVAKQAFDTNDYFNTGMPLWFDTGDFEIGYNKTNLYNQGGAYGLLALHFSNGPHKAEIIPIDPSYSALVDGAMPHFAIPGHSITIPVRLVNETSQACNYALAASQPGAPWPVVLSQPNVFVPAHAFYEFKVTVTVPETAVPGDATSILLTASCGSPPVVVADTTLEVMAGFGFFMPLIGQ